MSLAPVSLLCEMPEVLERLNVPNSVENVQLLCKILLQSSAKPSQSCPSVPGSSLPVLRPLCGRADEDEQAQKPIWQQFPEIPVLSNSSRAS